MRRGARHVRPVRSHRCKSVLSFCRVPHKKAVNDDYDADDWKRYERHANAWAAKVLRESGSDLSADGCAGMHDECDENVHVPFQGMSYRSVTRGDDDLKEIRTNGDMGRYAQQIDQARHANVTGTTTEIGR